MPSIAPAILQYTLKRESRLPPLSLSQEGLSLADVELLRCSCVLGPPHSTFVGAQGG